MSGHPENPAGDLTAVVIAARRGDDSGLRSPAPRVRVAALAALSAGGHLRADHVVAALADADARVRRQGCEVAAGLGPAVPALVALLADPDPLVAEAAACALGEGPGGHGVVTALGRAATDAPHPLVREAAVAALGSLGDDEALPVILRALRDVVTVRRRAVLALAPFSGPAVTEALEAALEDRDWQVRNAARDLLP